MKKDLKKCVDFHGHLCGGLLMGYRAAKAAMKNLKSSFAKDEEVVAIVENSSCFVDAVSVLTGCTFGKGNLIFKDYGKMVLFLLSRKDGKGVRVSFKSENNDKAQENFYSLMNKVLHGKANDKEKSLFKKIKKEREKKLLTKKDEDLLNIKRIKMPLPARAKIFKSVKCDKCGESVMETRIRKTKKGDYCLECLEK
ncbi:MAG: formylmethanofuran dehydrogenase [Elusimicrobia bacterium]|nr:formylmethanofuran dehydrogenase [Elusimicrobiota bacterium]